jgi:hypothetical protein
MAQKTALDTYETLIQRLHDPHRQFVMYALDKRYQVTLDELAAAMSAWKSGLVGPRPDEEKMARVNLHHVHLPALEAAGLVDYDTSAGVVTRQPPTAHPHADPHPKTAGIPDGHKEYSG